MSDPNEPVQLRLRELERAFVGFERGERNRLFEARDALTGLTEAVEQGGAGDLLTLCELSSRILGILLMEGGLSEVRAVGVVREVLALVERNLAPTGAADAGPGGVFHVVNAERLGDILVRRGLVAPDQLEKALVLQRVSKGRRVGEVLIAMNVLDQRTLDEVLDTQRGDTRRAQTRRGAAQRQAAGAGPTAGSIPPLPGVAPQRSIPLPPCEPPTLPIRPGAEHGPGSTGAPLPPPLAPPRTHPGSEPPFPFQGGR